MIQLTPRMLQFPFNGCLRLVLWITLVHLALGQTTPDTCLPDKHPVVGQRLSSVTFHVEHIYEGMSNFDYDQPKIMLNELLVLNAGDEKQITFQDAVMVNRTVRIHFTGSEVCAAIRMLRSNREDDNYFSPVHAWSCNKICIPATHSGRRKLSFFEEKGGRLVSSNPMCCVYQHKDFLQLGILESNQIRQCYTYLGDGSESDVAESRRTATCGFDQLCQISWRYRKSHDSPPFYDLGCSSGLTMFGCWNGCKNDVDVTLYSGKVNHYDKVCSYCCDSSNLCNDIVLFGAGSRLNCHLIYAIAVVLTGSLVLTVTTDQSTL